MSKTYDLIAASLNEIIKDLEETGGKNLKRETITDKIISIDAIGKRPVEKIVDRSDEDARLIRRRR